MDLHVTAFYIAFATFSVSAIDQATIDYMATYMEVRYEVLDNLRDELRTFEAQITLTNRGSSIIKGDPWIIYFCHIRMIEPEHLPDPNGIIRDDVKITHIQGCMFTLEPTNSFKTIIPGGSKKIRFLGENWIVSKTDIMPNWYITSQHLNPRTIMNTAGESLSFAGDFDEVKKWKRYYFQDGKEKVHDLYDPYTTRYRFALNNIKDHGKSPCHVIPTPLEIHIIDKQKILLNTRDWVVIYPERLSNEGFYLIDKLNILRSITQPLHRYIKLAIEEVRVKVNGSEKIIPEGYSLEIDPEAEFIKILGVDAAGVFYGIQTLFALIDEEGNVPKANISDAPRYPYRGMELDVARNFFEQKTIFKLLDLMAMYKLNKFHFHLTDDEGWRIEIQGLQELTEIGGQRCHNPSEERCIMSQLGSGPTIVGSGSGYYSKKQYQEILRYAKQRHIEVIPEIDMPGHGHAVIKAMEARSKKMMNNQFLLIDHNDTSKYKSIQMYTDNAINPCMSSSYTFIRKVIESLVIYHKDIMPLKIYHFGGDEVASGAWENSTACEDLMKNKWQIIEKKILKEYFVHQISNITFNYNLDLAAWEDGVMESGSKPFKREALQNKNVYAYAWDNIWEWGQSNRAYKLANAGYKVVMSQATHLYFDHPYEPDPEERGYYWAPRFTDTRKTFGFMPENLYNNADVARSGQPLTEEQVCGKDAKNCVKLEKPENIVGIQGHLWSETVRKPEQLDFMLFPRLLALAERAWHYASWEDIQEDSTRKKRLNEDWELFANTIGYKELKRLDSFEVDYRIPPPGGMIKNGRLVTNTAFPGLVVQYSRNGGKSWHDVDDKAIIESGKELQLRTKSASGGRTSRIVTLKNPGNNGGVRENPFCSLGLYSFIILFVIYLV